MNLKFQEVSSRDNLPNKIKDGAYLTNLDQYSDFGTNWTALYALNNNITYFDSFGVENIPKEIQKKIIGNKNIQANIFRIQTYHSVMRGFFSIDILYYFCIFWFINFMVKNKSLTDFNNLFSPNDFKKMMI